MFMDASVIVAILNQEPGWNELSGRLADQSVLYISPLVRFEASLAIANAAAKPSNRRPSPEVLARAKLLVDDFVSEISAKEIIISGDIGNRAIDASMNYGKAIGHPADLNFGDCFAYACAKAYRVKLLYKGDDFAKTDLA